MIVKRAAGGRRNSAWCEATSRASSLRNVSTRFVDKGNPVPSKRTACPTSECPPSQQDSTPRMIRFMRDQFSVDPAGVTD